MAYEEPFSHVTDMKGIAVDLPFCRFRYVKILNDSQKQVRSDSTVQIAPAENTQGTNSKSIRIDYTKPAETTTLGIDPMVSFASVIHELSYGRIDGYTAGPEGENTYPVIKDEMPHNLDAIV